MPMPSLELTPLESWKLRELTRSAVGRVVLRALMVLWRAEGLTTLDIGARLDCHRDTVTLWVERYRLLGVEGLEDDPRSGRPPQLDPAAREQVEAVLDQAPPEANRPCSCWTLAHLRTVFLGVLDRPFCQETLRRAVHLLDFRWRRPRLWAHKEDPETYEKQLLVELARQHAEETAASSDADPAAASAPIHLLYADASDQRLLAVIRSMWMRRGQQVRVQTPPRNGHWALFGSLNALTGAFHWQAYEKAVTASFLGFLAHLLEAYPRGEILLVVDNATYHTSKAVVAWLKKHPRLLLLYLPTRRPDLNPVEQIWKQLKQAVTANRSFPDLLTLGQFIRRHFASLSPADFLVQAGLRSDFCGTT
jgi:transposase